MNTLDQLQSLKRIRSVAFNQLDGLRAEVHSYGAEEALLAQEVLGPALAALDACIADCTARAEKLAVTTEDAVAYAQKAAAALKAEVGVAVKADEAVDAVLEVALPAAEIK